MSFSVVSVRETFDSGFSISGSVSNGRTKVSSSASKQFIVVTSAANPSLISEVEVACLSSLPVVNRSTWVSADGTAYMPFAVCRSKSVQRRPDNGLVFDVTCTYETGDTESEQCAAAPPVSLTDITPTVTANIGSYERTLYSDKSNPSVQCWQYEGTKTPFAQPVLETIPTLQLVIEQFEASITFDQMLERSFKVNSSTYRSKAAGLWRIGAVKAVEQDVQLAGGPTTAVKVTYPIALSERFFYPPGDDVNKTVYGHDQVIPLVDSWKVDAGNIVPNKDAQGRVRAGYINTDGTERVPGAANEKRPDYLQFKVSEEIDFGTFLQV